MRRLVIKRHLWFIPITLWAILVFTSLQWNLINNNSHIEKVVLAQARLAQNIIKSTGIYQKNHSRGFNLPQNGTPLAEENNTLKKTDIRPYLHLSSLTPLNTSHTPLGWEKTALTQLANNTDLVEWYTSSGQKDGTLFHYLIPFKAEKKCLQCHRQNPGNILGGLSITFSPLPLLNSEQEHQTGLFTIHIGIWLVLSLLTLFALSRHRQQLLQQDQLILQQDKLVERRTAQLEQEVLVRKEAEERLRNLLDSSGECILIFDHQGRCSLANVSALKTLGYQITSQILGRKIHDLLCWHAEPTSICYNHQKANEDCPLTKLTLTPETISSDELYFRCANNTQIPVAVNVSPIKLDGYQLGVMFLFSDITCRKKHEQTLRKLSRALDYSPSTTMITDAHGTIEYVNRKFSETSGYESREVIGKNPSIMQSGKTPTETYKALWQHISAGKHWHGPILNRKKDGGLIWEDISISPVNDDGGNITHYVAIKEDVTERRKQEEEAWRLANFDTLTGLMNRHCFTYQLEHYISKSRRYNNTFAILFIDLDGFKEVNDTFGHDAGDDLLKDAANRLKTNVRDSDIVARLGGDEFTIILPTFDYAHTIENLATKLLSSLADTFFIKGQHIHISASIGIALYPLHGRTHEALINHADSAMYQAKAKGKNNYQWYNENDLEAKVIRTMDTSEQSA